MPIEDHSVAPQNGKKPEYLVIFFHSSGSNGGETAHDVGELLGPLMPEAKIICPDGPVDLNWGGGRDWFEIRDLQQADTIDSDEIARRATAAAKDVNAYIDKVIAEEGIPAERVIIAGFSLGATMAFYAALLRDQPVGAVFCLSGGALDRLKEPKSKPPVGLAVGEKETGSYSGVWHTVKAFKDLEATGFRTDCVIIPGQGHVISEKAMELLMVYARRVTTTPWQQDNNPANPPRLDAGPRM